MKTTLEKSVERRNALNYTVMAISVIMAVAMALTFVPSPVSATSSSAEVDVAADFDDYDLNTVTDDSIEMIALAQNVMTQFQEIISISVIVEIMLDVEGF